MTELTPQDVLADLLDSNEYDRLINDEFPPNSKRAAAAILQRLTDAGFEVRTAPKTTPTDWQPIDTAPRDGSVIEVTNECMDCPVNAKWGKYVSRWGHESDEFVIVKDFDEIMPMRPGTLMCPTKWRNVTR